MAKNKPVMMKRPNYIVADLDRALALYRDILGFEVEHIKESDEASYSYPCFGIDPSAKLRFCTMNAGDQIRCFALTEVSGQPLPPKQTPRDHAIVVNVDRMDAIKAQLVAGGYEIMEEGVFHSTDGTTGRELGVIDADGHLVVLYQAG